MSYQISVLGSGTVWRGKVAADVQYWDLMNWIRGWFAYEYGSENVEVIRADKRAYFVRGEVEGMGTVELVARFRYVG